MYLNLYKNKWVIDRKFILTLVSLSKYFKFYGFDDFTNPFLLSNFSRTNQFYGHLSGTDLERNSRVPVERKWSLQVKCLVQQLPKVLSWGMFDFYESLDRQKMDFRQLCTLRCFVTLTYTTNPNLKVYALFCKYLYILFY